jgi:hypothetical protein
MQKIREFVLNDVPDNGQVDAEILVDQDVPKARELVPLHFRIRQSRRIGNPLCSLTEYFEIPDNGIHGLLVRRESFK